MFDMSFSEIAVIGVVALVVLGPERLPKVARTAGHMFGRLQRYVATVKADINREMDTSELAKLKQEVQDAARSFEQTVQQTANNVEKDTTALSQSVEIQTPAADAPAATSPTQNAMLETQEHGLVAPATETANAESPAARAHPASDRSTAPLRAEVPVQASLDFGIEPVRMTKPV
ncbi:MAG: Sec-independent protein translocase protein TatB [Usitatibacteraceae bacterium]